MAYWTEIRYNNSVDTGAFFRILKNFEKNAINVA